MCVEIKDTNYCRNCRDCSRAIIRERKEETNAFLEEVVVAIRVGARLQA